VKSHHVFPGVIALITEEDRVELRHYRHVLAHELSRCVGLRVSSSSFGVKFESPPDRGAVERAILGLGEADAPAIVPSVNDSAPDGLKFRECLPPDLATRVVQTRLSETDEVAATLRLPTRIVTTT
jgi:hypothetical protein